MKHEIFDATIKMLKELDAIYELHSELGDTAVREDIREVVEKSIMNADDNYSLPDEVAMLTPEGNSLVLEALKSYISDPVMREFANSELSPDVKRDIWFDVEDGDLAPDEFFGG